MEPDDFATVAMVFPAHAGMSLPSNERKRHVYCFPRSRGDEPERTGWHFLAVPFSPLTRG